MRKDSLIKLLAVIAVIVGLFIVYVSPLAYSIRQGLDLQGGTHVVLEAEDTAEAKVNEDAMTAKAPQNGSDNLSVSKKLLRNP